MNLLTFLLDAATDGAGSAGGTNTTPTGGDLLGGMAMPIIMILMLVAMWWFTSRSQKKRDQEAQNMRDGLQVGDEVTTIGGIIGKVVSIKEETFVLETTKEKTHIRFLKAAIRSVDVRVADLTAPETKDEPAEQPAEEPKKKFSFFDRKKK
ncbi:MAG: preprotein translocase subunit YajC [Clostridia bacterium]|nr:preprotein translocase subunit YajC [Clostridia bacterium]